MFPPPAFGGMQPPQDAQHMWILVSMRQVLSIHMCLKQGGGELFKAINYGGKDELFLYTSVWLYGKKKVREYFM